VGCWVGVGGALAGFWRALHDGAPGRCFTLLHTAGHGVARLVMRTKSVVDSQVRSSIRQAVSPRNRETRSATVSAV